MNKPAVILVLALIVGLLGGILGANITLGTKQDSILVKTLVVEDRLIIGRENGRLVTLGFGKDSDELSLGIWDDKKDKSPRAALFVAKEGPGVLLSDKAGGMRVFLGLDADEEPSLILADKKGQGRAFLGNTSIRSEAFFTGNETIEKRPASSLVLVSKEGKVVWQVP